MKPIHDSLIEIPEACRFLTKRVMDELLRTGIIMQPSHDVDLAKLRIVIGKALAIAYRMGGRD